MTFQETEDSLQQIAIQLKRLADYFEAQEERIKKTDAQTEAYMQEAQKKLLEAIKLTPRGN